MVDTQIYIEGNYIYKWSTSYNASQVISGIFASGMFALLTYTLKSVFSQYMLKNESQVGTDESDEHILLSVEANPYRHITFTELLTHQVYSKETFVWTMVH